VSAALGAPGRRHLAAERMLKWFRAKGPHHAEIVTDDPLATIRTGNAAGPRRPLEIYAVSRLVDSSEDLSYRTVKHVGNTGSLRTPKLNNIALSQILVG
jgi:hypothetical protein